MKILSAFLLGAAVAGALVVAACTQPAHDVLPLKEACSAAIGNDADINRKLLSGSVNLEALCGCYSQTVHADSRQDADLHTRALTDIADVRATDNLGAEDAAQAIMDEMKVDPASHGFTEDAFDDVGEYLAEVAKQLGDTGTCAVEG